MEGENKLIDINILMNEINELKQEINKLKNDTLDITTTEIPIDKDPTIEIITNSKKMPKEPFKELCFAGAGHKGIAYVGALKYLEDNNLISLKTLKKTVGTSIGSFILACYLIGYSVDEMLELTMNTDTGSFNDYSFSNYNSILKGTKFTEWVISAINNKMYEVTFKKLYEKTGVHFIVVSLSLKKGVIYMDHENSPDVILYDALIASMSIPLLFPPREINGDKFIDAFFVENFAFHKLNSGALGIKMICDPPTKENLFTYLIQIKDSISKHIVNLEKPSSNNIIGVNCSGFERFDLNMNDNDKITLYKRGYDSTKEYFENNNE